MSSRSEVARFRLSTHVKYFNACLESLPAAYVTLDTSRLTGLYFCIVGLDMLGALDTIQGGKERICNFVYQMQLVVLDAKLDINSSSSSSSGGSSGSSSNKTFEMGYFGFIGSNYLNHNICMPCNADIKNSGHNHHDNSDGINRSSNSLDCNSCNTSSIFYQSVQGHIAMIYCSLCILVTLGDDLSRLDRQKILRGVGRLQEPNGSFKATMMGSENDVRFVYCAFAICAILEDFSHIDMGKSLEYLKSCITFEGAFALVPMAESHGGSTYCALSALRLVEGGLERALDKSDLRNVELWCLKRQIGGFQGRCNKDEDSCYSYWISASLSALNRFNEIDHKLAIDFLLNECQASHKIGGFSKYPAYVYDPDPNLPDILHSFYSIAFLSLAKTYFNSKYGAPNSETAVATTTTATIATTTMEKEEEEVERALWRELASLQDFDPTFALCSKRVSEFKKKEKIPK